jgi:glutamine amidotransferase
MIGIVDTGGANHASIQNALVRLGRDSLVSLDREVLSSCSHLILPGVGHAGHAMERLREHQLVDYIREQSKPVLGICLGMQILFEASDEGAEVALGLLPGRVKRLCPSSTFRVPHMGWNRIEHRKQSSKLLRGLDEKTYFYFVHSFAVPDSTSIVAATPAPQAIPSVLEWRNFYAVQFHPERSGPGGARLLENFLLEAT